MLRRGCRRGGKGLGWIEEEPWNLKVGILMLIWESPLANGKLQITCVMFKMRLTSESRVHCQDQKGAKILVASRIDT